jgi:hypothetical protein
MKRILIAGLLGGLAMFVWTSIAHMILPLGTIGIQEMQNESAVLDAMQTTIGASSGMYLFPGMGLGPNPSNKEMRAAMPAYQQKLATTPSGILIYHPPGQGMTMTPARLGVEFANEVLAALFAVVLLSCTRLSGYAGRVAFVTLVGVIAAMPTNISYWNWYGFPGRYTAASMCIQIVGFLVAGLVAAAIVGRGTARAQGAPA